MITCSESAAGVCPETALPKLSVGWSSEIESADCRSISTPAATSSPLVGGGGGGGGVIPHEAAAATEFSGEGAPVAKSAEFESLSVQPLPARRLAVVFVTAGAAPAPSKSVAEP